MTTGSAPRLGDRGLAGQPGRPLRRIASALLTSTLVVAACASSPGAGPTASPPPSPAAAGDETAAAWFRNGAVRAHGNGAGRAEARNLILFVGDGMSLATVAAARIFEGQRRGQPGEENSLSFETLPHTALSKTYNTDSQTPDSAGTMTAMATGVKTRMGAIGTGPAARRGDCAAARQASLATLIEIAEAAGLATGIVTTTRLTHATPAATYAHVPDRNWENDTDLPPEAVAAGCRDIARQFVEFSVGDGIEVALGGGRREFMPATQVDPENDGLPGERLDERDLVQEWRQRQPEGRYVWNARELKALDLANTTRLLGLFEHDHMQFEHDRPGDVGGEPSLAEMTAAAITMLSRHPQGFVLLVEGGRIDHAHHSGNAYRALVDTVAFSDAVRVAMERTSADDTLILVTADHSHTLNFVGYPTRGNPILGKVTGSSGEDAAHGLARDLLGLPYTTLVYANGPGYTGASQQQPAGPKQFDHWPTQYEPALGRPNLNDVDTTHPDYLQESIVPTASETHGGDDVGIWARGPGADAVRGTIEQNTIFHFLLQSQPTLVRWLCARGDCEQGVPARLPQPLQKPGSP